MTMGILNIFFFLISLLFIKQSCGLHKVIGKSVEEECMTKFTTCFKSRNCESRIKEMDHFCCKYAFENNTYLEEREDECVEDRLYSDAEDCLSGLDENCQSILMEFFLSNDKKLEEIEKELKKSFGQPTDINDCRNYVKRVEKEECLMCSDKDDDDKTYGWICDIIRSTRKSSLYCTREKDCMEIFTQCLVKEITIEMVKTVDVTCCKAVFNKEGEFFENKQNCEQKSLLPMVIKCMTQNHYYESQISKYFNRNSESIKKFFDSIRDELGTPSSKEECEDHFQKEKIILLETCLLNTNKNMTSFCKIFEEIMMRKDYSSHDSFNNYLKK